jgi:predicted acetyltransferase
VGLRERQDSRDIQIGAITESELSAWVHALDASFLLAVPEGAVTFFKELHIPGRSLGAFSVERCVGTLRSLDLEVTVPRGAVVGAEGITNVAVVPDHRRRGLLSRMMRLGLDGAAARGRALAALIASEYRIYGRFGFGPATCAVGYNIDVRRAGGVRIPGADDGTVETLNLDDVGRFGPELHERFRRTQPGAIARDHTGWRLRTGDLRNPYREWTQPMAVLYRGTDEVPAGMALYHADGTWQDGDPDFALTVHDLFAVHLTAAAALWRHLLTSEWATRVTAANIAPDDPLPLLLDNPRACVRQAGTGADHLWLRILDVARALQARTYDAPGRLVLDVTDRLGYASGRFVLQTGRDGNASVTPADEPADLAMDVSTLGTIYLGDQTVHRLAAAGLVTEGHTGAVARADRMLRTAVRPWCPDSF